VTSAPCPCSNIIVAEKRGVCGGVVATERGEASRKKKEEKKRRKEVVHRLIC